MIITLPVLIDIYTKPDIKTGKQKLIRRDQEYLKQFETTEIKAEQFTNAKGLPSKKWCLIREGDAYFKINKKFEEIRRLTEHVVIKGFKG